MDGFTSLTQFVVTFSYRKDGTTWEIREKRRGDPVARVHKPGPPDRTVPFDVYGGPRLDELIGLVTSGDAATADRTLIGRVGGRTHSNLFKQRWTFEQFGLGVLEGRARGLGSMVRNTVGSFSDNDSAGYLVAPLTVHYRSSDSEGFTLARHAGPLSRFDIAVKDPRIDRLLVLAAVRLFDHQTGDWDARKLVPVIGGLLGRSTRGDGSA